MDSFDAQILTPEGPLFSGLVTGVRVPGTEGSFEVKTGHAPLISSLEPGKLIVRPAGSSQEKLFAVSGGLLEVHDNMLNLLAESAEPVSEIDLQRAKEARERASDRLKQAATDSSIDQQRAQEAKSRAENRIRLSADVAVKTQD